MPPHDTILLFQAVLASGLACLLSIAAINKLHAFHGAVWAIGNTMRMAPTIETPLLLWTLALFFLFTTARF